ncbi:GSCFA domain-containing protein (plasmid) [Rhodopseudomonas palustris]
MAKNKLRQYPGVNKGKDRLLPYARPQILTEEKIPEGASYFVVGNCFGRNIEKALRRAERTVLSSPTNLDLPGSAQEQFNRFNIFNLDVSTNEIAWAIDPNASSLDDALIEVDGEWVDMQIHWTFAHDEALARQYRKVYNASYSSISQADTVIVALSGVEQWFDTRTGLYMNGMPTNKMVEQAPGRFEFHRLDLDGCVASLRRFCNLVRTCSKKNPLIIVAVSPVSQPVVHGQADALVDQFLAKAMQRTAADIVCAEFDRIEYLPALEAAMLSDFRFGYQETSLNHTTQCLANRIVAEMLLKYEGESKGQRLLHAVGHTEALILAGEHEAAIKTAEQIINTGVATTDELDQLYVRALTQTNRHADGVAHLLARLEAGLVSDVDRIYQRLINMIRGHGNEDQLARLQVWAISRGLDIDAIEAVRNAWAVKPTATAKGLYTDQITQIIAAMRNDDHEAVVQRSLQLLDVNGELSKSESERIFTYLVQGLIRLGRHTDAITHLSQAVENAETPDPRRARLLVNLARSHADVETINKIIALGDRLGDTTLIELLEARRVALESAQRKPATN